jgi:outer membrane murein-binding lipoprotein Lpp
MSETTLIILSVILAVVVIAVLAAALIKIRQDLEKTSTDLETLAGALTMVESDHLQPLEPAVKAINAQFDVILSALPGIAAKAKVVAERRPT